MTPGRLIIYGLIVVVVAGLTSLKGVLRSSVDSFVSGVGKTARVSSRVLALIGLLVIGLGLIWLVVRGGS
jgi:hypothetical protein